MRLKFLQLLNRNLAVLRCLQNGYQIRDQPMRKKLKKISLTKAPGFRMKLACRQEFESLNNARGSLMRKECRWLDETEKIFNVNLPFVKSPRTGCYRSQKRLLSPQRSPKNMDWGSIFINLNGWAIKLHQDCTIGLSMSMFQSHWFRSNFFMKEGKSTCCSEYIMFTCTIWR